MKTFGLFIFLFILMNAASLLIFPKWTESEIIMYSTLLAYIMQQYFVEEINKK